MSLLVSGIVLGTIQAVPIVSLRSPELEFPEGFPSLTALRELRDGRVMVLDRCQARVIAIDFSGPSAEQVGGIGAGPGEYRTAERLWALPGDSSAIFDRANLRYLVVDGDGKPREFFRGPGNLKSRAGRYTVDAPFSIRGTDSRGWFYATQDDRRATEKGIILLDSIPIERWNPRDHTRETVGFIRRDRDADRRVRFVERPFAEVRTWAVASDGTVAIVYPGDYHVEFYDPSGRHRVGRPNSWKPVPTNEHHKALWRESQHSGCTSSASRMGVVRIVEPEGTLYGKPLPVREPSEWPRYLPPFLGGGAMFAPDGMLWLLRTDSLGRATVYDLIDSTGRVTRKVVMPAESRVLGFGKEKFYVIRKDLDDLQFVQVFSRTLLDSGERR